MASTLGVKNPYRYRGYRYDTETGYYYLQSRYYNPTWGRFINADDAHILGLAQGQIHGANLFAYCVANPVMYEDPSGYKPRLTHLYHGIRTLMGVLALIVGFRKTTKWWVNFSAKKAAPFLSKILFRIGSAKVFAGTAIAGITTQQYHVAIAAILITIPLVLEISYIVDQLRSGIWEIRQFFNHNHK